MPMSSADAVRLANDLIDKHNSRLMPDALIGKIQRYLRGDHDLPYMPKGAKVEYKRLAEKSITNWLPLIPDTFAKGLFVDGYRPANTNENSPAWEYWQANGMDARQVVAHRGALEYGTSYVLVLPGKPYPVIRPIPATKCLGFYEDDDADWPEYGIIDRGRAMDGSRLYDLLDKEAVYRIVKPSGSADTTVSSVEYHRLGVTPLVRFRDRLDGDAVGVVAPLIRIQDRINEIVFTLMIALQYGAFRQRWAAGLVIPVDEEETLPDGSPNPNYGRPIEPFKAAVDRLWVTDNPDAKFGEFGQTDVRGHLDSYTSTVKTLASVSQISPMVLMGDLVNLSAEALAAATDTTQRKINEYETLFGESWEQVFRLASLAAGDMRGASDISAQVRWRDTEARSLAQTVDALGKMAQMLMIPVEELWSRIPGVTEQDVQRWREAARSADGLAALAEALTRQSQPTLDLTQETEPGGTGA